MPNSISIKEKKFRKRKVIYGGKKQLEAVQALENPGTEERGRLPRGMTKP